LCDDPSEGIVVGKLSEEGLCEEQHQCLCLVQRPQQPLTDAVDC
jgi:hypothetical protein